MTSIATNVGALLAQRYLRAITSELTITQNRLSSGLRVSTVTETRRPMPSRRVCAVTSRPTRL
jgi:hypothetical protein